MEIKIFYYGLKENKEVILTDKWWNTMRYFKIGERLKQKFDSDKQLLQQCRALFASTNDKLSYYDFFQFLEKTMKIEIEDWEEDSLETRLDRLGMAFIEFNEFNEFCIDYNIDFKEKLKENDLEDILD